LFVRQTDSVSLLLGRWPVMLGTNPVGYILCFEGMLYVISALRVFIAFMREAEA
jgi:hypothetical protein